MIVDFPGHWLWAGLRLLWLFQDGRQWIAKHVCAMKPPLRSNNIENKICVKLYPNRSLYAQHNYKPMGLS